MNITFKSIAAIIIGTAILFAIVVAVGVPLNFIL